MRVRCRQLQCARREHQVCPNVLGLVLRGGFRGEGLRPRVQDAPGAVAFAAVFTGPSAESAAAAPSL